MLLRDPLPDFPTIEQIRQWAQMNVQSLRYQLMFKGLSAGDLVGPIHNIPAVQCARAHWRNARPFPTDEEILLMLILMGPRDQIYNEMDDKAWKVVAATIFLLSAPDPVPTCVRVDIYRRKLLPLD